MLKEWQQAVIFLTYKNTLFSISQKYFVKIYYQKKRKRHNENNRCLPS